MKLELPKPIQDNIAYFTGREWLLPLLRQWFLDNDARVLVLTGDPGTGKSMVLSWLARFGPLPFDATAAENLTWLRGQVTGYHFCQASSRNNSPQAFAENLAIQLTRSMPGFGNALVATLADRVELHVEQTIVSGGSQSRVTGIAIGQLNLGGLSDEAIFDRTFAQPLKRLDPMPGLPPCLLLVDALDEAETYTGPRQLASLLAGLDDLPMQVRLLVTSRPDSRVLKYYCRGAPFDRVLDLAGNAPGDTDDVYTYTLARLATRIPTLPESAWAASARRISRSAQGNFLFTAMVLNDLGPRLAQDPDLEIDNFDLPAGLSAFYHQFLLRELAADNPRWTNIYEPLLGLLAVARGDGLTATQLGAILGQDVGAPLRTCDQYLTGTRLEGPFRPFHRSFVDFLVGEGDHSSNDYRINIVKAHQRIVQSYLARPTNTWNQCDAYGLTYLVDHLFVLAQHDDTQARQAAIQDLVSTLSDNGFLNARVKRFGLYPVQFDLTQARELLVDGRGFSRLLRAERRIVAESFDTLLSPRPNHKPDFRDAEFTWAIWPRPKGNPDGISSLVTVKGGVFYMRLEAQALASPQAVLDSFRKAFLTKRWRLTDEEPGRRFVYDADLLPYVRTSTELVVSTIDVGKSLVIEQQMLWFEMPPHSLVGHFITAVLSVPYKFPSFHGRPHELSFEVLAHDFSNRIRQFNGLEAIRRFEKRAELFFDIVLGLFFVDLFFVFGSLLHPVWIEASIRSCFLFAVAHAGVASLGNIYIRRRTKGLIMRLSRAWTLTTFLSIAWTAVIAFLVLAVMMDK